MKNLIKKLNRIFQDYMREKRLKIGKYIWDRKEKAKIIPRGLEAPIEGTDEVGPRQDAHQPTALEHS